MSTLRSASLGALVVAAAVQGDFASIVHLTNSGLWFPDADACTAIAALLVAPETTLHDVHCRRGLEAVLSGRHWTRGRAVLRSRQLAAAINRLLEDECIDIDAMIRLVRMGAPHKMLSLAVMRHLPEWGADLLRMLTRNAGSKEIAELVLASTRPGTLLLLVSDVIGTLPEHVFACCPDALDDVALLERLAGDGEFMNSRHAGRFIQCILFLACRTGSEHLVEAVEAAEATSNLSESQRKAVKNLCRNNCPHLAERVGAMRMMQSHPVGGSIMQLVEYGAQDMRLELSAVMMNYNALRIMSGLGGLAYNS